MSHAIEILLMSVGGIVIICGIFVALLFVIELIVEGRRWRDDR